MIAVGIDSVEIHRIQKSVGNPRFCRRVFGNSEYSQLALRGFSPSSAAASFSAKEAFAKVLGTGVRGFSLSEVELLRDEWGAPYLKLSGAAAQMAEEKGFIRFSVSVTHTKQTATVIVIGEQKTETGGGQMKLFSAQQMKNLEKKASECGIGYDLLMENAGAAVVRFLLKKFSIKGKKVVILCGKGNNGGDGFVAARRLIAQEARVAVVLVEGDPQTACAQNMFQMLSRSYARVVPYQQERETVSALLYSADLILDAVYGIGFHGKVPESLEGLFLEASQAAAPVVSVDIPSGVVCDTGAVNGVCIQAKYTVTFSALKPAHLLKPGKQFCGEVQVAPVGIQGDLMEQQPGLSHFEPREAWKIFSGSRKEDGHKGDFGDVFCICGSKGMAGAAAFSIGAALRSGVGLVHAAVGASIYPIVCSYAPEAVYTVLEEEQELSLQDRERVTERILRADACLIGCGCGTSERSRQLLELCLSMASCPIVIDADGINLIARNIDMLKAAKGPVILTPHPGEMSRLLGISTREIQENRLEIAEKFAREQQVILVLKGAGTIIASGDGRLFLNTTGNSGMAKGGSGDVLAGMIAAQAAQGKDPMLSAAAAVCMHGSAGDWCASKKTQTAMLPRDMIEALPQFFADLEGAC